MTRIARVVAPGYPHHITQRGNRRQKTFFCDDDYRQYLALAAQFLAQFDVEVWAYCLMPNHVHLIAVPESEDGLRRALGEAHRRYCRHVNSREGWRGHLWQGRFASYVMDESHLLAAVRYVELNPVQAGLAKHPGDWPWSSARTHLDGRQDDGLVRVQPMLGMVDDWAAYLAMDLDEKEAAALRHHERTGRPAGSEDFVQHLESLLGRYLRKKKPGPKRKGRN